MKRYFFLFLLFVSLNLYSNDLLDFSIKQISPESKHSEIEIILQKTARYLETRNPDDIKPGKVPGVDIIREEPAPYYCELTAVFDGAGWSFSVEMTNEGETRTLGGQMLGTVDLLADDTAVRLLSDIIFNLYADFNHFFMDVLASPPELIDQIHTDFFIQKIFSGVNYYMPLDIAVKGNGNPVIAFSGVCLELDKGLKILSAPGKSLYDRGNYSSAAKVTATPGGTLFISGAMGKEFYRLDEFSSEPQKIRSPLELQGGYTALADGSVLIVDSQTKTAVRMTDKSMEKINLFTSPQSYLFSLADGPDNTIWTYDMVSRTIYVHSYNGVLLDSIKPVVDMNAGFIPSQIEVYPNGDFVAFSMGGGGLWKFDSHGKPLWVLTEIGGQPFPQVMYLALDKKDSILYLADQMGKKLYLLQDNIEDHPNDFINSFKEYNDPIERLSRQAEYYLSKGALEASRSHLESILEIDPFYTDVNPLIEDLDISLIKQRIDDEEVRVLSLLDELGPESARMAYSQTVKLYEKLLSRQPDKEYSERLKKLKEFFFQREAAPPPENPLRIHSVNIEPIFPSLIYSYREKPVGSALIENPLNREIPDIKVSFYIKNFMDFPVIQEKIYSIPAGGRIEIPLWVELSQKALELQEDLPVSVRIELNYGERQVIGTGKTSIYRRTALTWDKTEKILPFITPHEETVSSFAHISAAAVDDSATGVGRKFNRAMAVCDALGAYSIKYIEDPHSPISEILGEKRFVDTVRFPRTTLRIRAGDCDDSTVLLASLLESVGIETAVMTSPGHIFLAFNSGLTAKDKWLFQDESLIVWQNESELWIPIEATALASGAYEAWKIAGRTISTHRSEEIEFIPVAEGRPQYPSLSLEEASFSVIEPTEAEILRLHEPVMQTIHSVLVDAAKKDLESRLESSRSPEKIENRLGILYARFGKEQAAIQLFKTLLDRKPEYLSARLNLANVWMGMGDYLQAVTLLEDGLSWSPESATLNLALSRCYRQLGISDKLERAFAVVEKSNPDLAAQFTYLGKVDSSVGRAGISDMTEELLWDSED